MWAKKLKNNLPQYNSQTVVRLIVSTRFLFQWNYRLKEREREKEHNWAVLEAHKTLGFYFVSLNLFKNLIFRFFFLLLLFLFLFLLRKCCCVPCFFAAESRERKGGYFRERECPCGRQICIRSDSIFSSFILFLSLASEVKCYSFSLPSLVFFYVSIACMHGFS